MAEDAMKDLREQVLACRRCPELVPTRTNVVFGEGDPRAKIMFVGEAPGRDEDLQGRPFVGAAGKLLTKCIEEIVGLKREEVYIANILKCRPKDNRDPKPEEMDNCREYVAAQIALIRPKVICLLGRISMGIFLGPDLKISRVHGTTIKHGGVLYLPIYHPAAALRGTTVMEQFKGDFVNLKRLLDSGF